jgi:hypothetical protein
MHHQAGIYNVYFIILYRHGTSDALFVWKSALNTDSGNDFPCGVANWEE